MPSTSCWATARGNYSLHVRVARISIGPGYNPTDEVHTAASDWAILSPRRRRFRPVMRPLPGHRCPADARGRPIAIGGFAQDRAYLMTADTHCRLGPTLASGKLLSHDCAI